MNKDERITNLVTKFMEVDPAIAKVEVRPVYHITTILKKGATLDERSAVYEREGELIDYLKKLGQELSVDFRVISQDKLR